MFLRKAARKRFKKKKAKEAEVPVSSGVPDGPIYYDELGCGGSAASSDVEYIEDDEHYVEPVPPPKLNVTMVQGKAKAANPANPSREANEKIPLSFVIQPNTNDGDNDSNLSQDAILTKLPRHLVEKSNRLLEPRPSITTSTTSEEHWTQVTDNTYSEVGSMSTISEKQENKGNKKLESWKEAKERQMSKLGRKNTRTVVIMMELGSTFLQYEDFEVACDYFANAVAASESLFDASDLRLAKANELLGVAECSNPDNKQNSEKLSYALSCLNKAYLVRYEKQGPRHVDTVSTLSRIGRVLTKMKKFEDARVCYYEVLKLREAIYGRQHACVAVSARALALVYMKLLQIQSAKYYFNFALRIYEENGLGHHGFASVIRKEVRDLNQLKVRFEV